MLSMSYSHSHGNVDLANYTDLLGETVPSLAVVSVGSSIGVSVASNVVTGLVASLYTVTDSYGP